MRNLRAIRREHILNNIQIVLLSLNLETHLGRCCTIFALNYFSFEQFNRFLDLCYLRKQRLPLFRRETVGFARSEIER